MITRLFLASQNFITLLNDQSAIATNVASIAGRFSFGEVLGKPLLTRFTQTADTLSLSRPSADFLSEPARRKPQAMKRHLSGGGRLSGLPFTTQLS